MRATVCCLALLALFATAAQIGCTGRARQAGCCPTRVPAGGPSLEAQRIETEETIIESTGMHIHYLEIVTPSVEATCDTYAAAYGVTFGDPLPEFGNARTTELPGGGLLGVRAPMHANETPTVRPYILVEDIESAIEAAGAGGAQILMPPTPMPGRGTFAIYELGGIQHGIWQHASP